MIYWTNTNSKMNVLPRSDGELSNEIKTYLIEAIGVDPFIIAKDLKIDVRKILRWQRYLGLREMTVAGGHKRYNINMSGHNRKVEYKEIAGND